MSRAHVALVSRDAQERNALASAFDAAPATWDVHLYDSAPRHADVVVAGSDVELSDAIRLDARRPTAVLDDVRRALGVTRGRTILVTGAGGGSGATTVALHVAQSLVALGPTVFVDLDVRWGSADRLGIDISGSRTWADGGATSSALPVRGGFRALLAPRLDEPWNAEAVLEAARADFRLVVVDAPAGHALEQVLPRADAALLVVAPTIPGARRAAALLDALDAEVPWAVVLNRLGPGGETRRAELEKLVRRPIAMELPSCAALRDAEDEGRLVTSPLYRWRRRVSRLARALATAAQAEA